MRYLLSIILCLIIKTTFGQSSLLWEVTGKNLKKPSYLYGTMHVEDERVFRFGDSVMIKFNQCKVYAGEIDLSSVSPAEAIKFMMMPKDISLDQLLDKDDYKFVKKVAEQKTGFMAPMIDKMKPIFSSVLITELGAKFSKSEKQNDSTISLDGYLQKVAKAKGMNVVGIETAEEQVAAIDKISLKEQAQMLLSSLKDSTKSDSMLIKMYEMYVNQDLDGLFKLVEGSEMPDMFNVAVLKNRNYVMADRITKMMKQHSTFIGIGAAHLPGNEGVIELLRKKGYTVRPVISSYTGKK